MNMLLDEKVIHPPYTDTVLSIRSLFILFTFKVIEIKEREGDPSQFGLPSGKLSLYILCRLGRQHTEKGPTK
jgi:hypothetical protein